MQKKLDKRKDRKFNKGGDGMEIENLDKPDIITQRAKWNSPGQ